jgi:hypothetical protein
MNAPAAIGLLHPDFADVATRIVPQRAGDFTAKEGETYAATENGLTLRLRVRKPRDRWTVIEARHSGATDPLLRGVIDTFCQVVEGLPLQEAADHGAIHALERLRGDPLARPIPGILTPRSAGTAFTSCERLIRSILAQLEAQDGAQDHANFWNPALSAYWREMSDAARIAALQPVIESFRGAHGLAADDLWVDRIEKARRVIIGFSAKVGYTAKPSLLMRLEVDIRQTTGNRLELFMAEAKDSNAIRRLTPEEEVQ